MKKIKKEGVKKANENCKFYILKEGAKFSIQRSTYWNSWEELKEGCQDYTNRKNKKYHNWLCFSCYEVLLLFFKFLYKFL